METNFIIDDGAKLFTFTNKLGEVFAEFTFNPADTAIVGRYEKVVEFFEGYTLERGEDEDSWIRTIEALDEELKKQFDFLLGREVSSTLFKTYNPCAIFAEGDFFCEIVLRTIAEVIESEMDVRLKKKAARIKKATAKYTK